MTRVFAPLAECLDVTALEDGQRGAGISAGEPGMALFPAGRYPACSRHGAMNRLGRERRIFRCLIEGCNVGLEWVGGAEAA